MGRAPTQPWTPPEFPRSVLMPWTAPCFGAGLCFVGEGNLTTFDISSQIIHKQLTIYGSWTFSLSGLAEVANFVVNRGVPLKDLITHQFSLEQAAEAYRLFDSGKTGKVVLVKS